MNLLRYVYGMDSVERHRSLAAIIRETLPPPASLLDVGGEASWRCNHLGRFLKGYSISTVNVTRPSDVSYSGGRLPFGDGAFDAVVSLDTAEHVPRADRAAWIEDFFRVARRYVIICAPLGTEFQSQVDRDLNNLFKRLFGYEHHYLSEHVTCTMPDLAEIKEWVKNRPHKLYFDGDARVFKRQMEVNFKIQKKGGPLKTPLKVIHGMYTLTDLKPLDLWTEPDEYTRRWYLSAEVTK